MFSSALVCLFVYLFVCLFVCLLAVWHKVNRFSQNSVERFYGPRKKEKRFDFGGNPHCVTLRIGLLLGLALDLSPCLSMSHTLELSRDRYIWPHPTIISPTGIYSKVPVNGFSHRRYNQIVSILAICSTVVILSGIKVHNFNFFKSWLERCCVAAERAVVRTTALSVKDASADTHAVMWSSRPKSWSRGASRTKNKVLVLVLTKKVLRIFRTFMGLTNSWY